MEIDDAVGKKRIESIDLLRGAVMILMALDHVRMYFGHATWYAEPTNLAMTTPLLFFTRWITHFCAPVFVFLASVSAHLQGSRRPNISSMSRHLFTRGAWLVLAELTIVNFAWTFDITFSFRILQVIWAIGVSMIILSALVFLPLKMIFVLGLILVFGHNLLDSVEAQGMSTWDIIWYALHQPGTIFLGDALVSLVYPVLPWIGLMALGYAFGILYTRGYDEASRQRWLLRSGTGAVLLFLVLRGFNLYGEPHPWNTQSSFLYTTMSFLNTTKYPASLQFLLMTMGPALIFLSMTDTAGGPAAKPVLIFGRVPFFFYIIHLYFIHALAMLWLVFSGRDWREYVLSASAIRSGSLSNFGLDTPAVYLVWILVIVCLYPLCRWYQKYKENNPAKWWLGYL